MVAKKKPKNAFIFFVTDWRKRQTNSFSWETSIYKAGLDWVKMSDKEKLPYKIEASRCNQAIKATTESSPNKQAQQPTPLTPEEEEQMKAKRHIDKIVNDSVQSIELETRMYCFIMVNYFGQIPKTNMYQPAELAMAEFSLQGGVQRLYHKLINPGPSVYGSEYVTKTHAKETHKLPIPPNAIGEDNLEGIFKDVLQFVKHKNEYRPIFTTTEQIPIVSSALKYLNGDIHELKIYSIEYLYYVLKKSSCQISGIAVPKNLYETNRVFERDLYEHELNLSCDYHEIRDLSKFCAKSCVTRWGFMFAIYMCNDLAITMLPKRHLPEKMPIPTIMPKLEMEVETKQGIEEPKKDNDLPTTPTRIKTECPENEDLWNDLKNLTDILEKEMGGIKKEIKDNDENEDNLAAPPPPPISLGEIDDELALFTRRMRTASEDGIKQEENSKKTNCKATKSKSDKISFKSKSNTDEKSSKSKGKPDQESSKSKSDHISRHKTRETERRSPRQKSRRERKVSRSRSRERRPHRKENSSSRHYRKSISPRARKTTVSRIGRRISRSKSREPISYRRRTYSKETSTNRNKNRRRRSKSRSRSRSRSRSNLRINRAIRRSRSRSSSRYRYSPNRLGSQTLSPIRRRPPLSERLDSPQPNQNHLTPSHSHPSAFTNAPSINNYQLPIHPAAATNPIPTVAPQHYPMPVPMHGSMQYSRTTTYSTQYYQANQMAPVPAGNVYKQPLLPAPAVPDVYRPYDLRHRLGPPPSLPSRYLNEQDLRHRIRGRPEFYGLQQPMYPNYVNYYPPPYMTQPNHYGSYHNLPPNVHY